MKFHYKAQLAAALIAAAFAGTALAGPVLYTTETTDITSTPGANVAGQVLAGTQVEELERMSGKARVRIRGWSRVADPTHISAEPGKPVIEAAFASSRTVKLDPSAGTAKILGATWQPLKAGLTLRNSPLTAPVSPLRPKPRRIPSAAPATRRLAPQARPRAAGTRSSRRAERPVTKTLRMSSSSAISRTAPGSNAPPVRLKPRV